MPLTPAETLGLTAESLSKSLTAVSELWGLHLLASLLCHLLINEENIKYWPLTAQVGFVRLKDLMSKIHHLPLHQEHHSSPPIDLRHPGLRKKQGPMRKTHADTVLWGWGIKERKSGAQSGKEACSQSKDLWAKDCSQRGCRSPEQTQEIDKWGASFLWKTETLCLVKQYGWFYETIKGGLCFFGLFFCLFVFWGFFGGGRGSSLVFYLACEKTQLHFILIWVYLLRFDLGQKTPSLW